MVALFVIMVPLGFIAPGIHQGHHYSIVIAALAIMASMIREGPVRWFLWYAALWCVLVHLAAIIDPLGPTELAKRAFGEVVFLLVGACIYVAAARSALKADAIYNIICVSALLQATIGLCQLFGYFPFMDLLRLMATVEMPLPIGFSYGCIGTLVNPNFFAAYMAITIPFFMRGKWKWCLPLILGMLLIQETSTAIIALGAGAIYYYRKWPVALGAVGAALLFVLVFDLKILTLESARFGYWLDLLRQIAGGSEDLAWLIGFGPGAFTGQMFPIHNDWLELLYRYGIIGLGLGIAYTVGILNRHRLLTTALVIAAVNCLGNYPMRLAPSAILIVVIMGLLERETREDIACNCGADPCPGTIH